MEIEQIATIHTDFPEKFGLPRQSGLVAGLKGQIVMQPQFRSREAFRGLEEYSHIWVLWEFSQARRESWSPTVKPPRLGGNKRMGVFATRSPFRPNAIGMSALKLDRIEYHAQLGPVLHVSGVDMLDGTPVYDIKPYLPYADSYPEAMDGFAGRVRDKQLTVACPDKLLAKLQPEDQENVKQLLSQDPRTAYVDDPLRIWGLSYRQYNIRFRVDGVNADVLEIETCQNTEKKDAGLMENRQQSEGQAGIRTADHDAGSGRTVCWQQKSGISEIEERGKILWNKG